MFSAPVVVYSQYDQPLVVLVLPSAWLVRGALDFSAVSLPEY